MDPPQDDFVAILTKLVIDLARIEGFAWSLPDSQRQWLVGKLENVRTSLNSLKQLKKEQV